MKRAHTLVLLGVAALVGIISVALVSANNSATIDFEGLAEGAIISQLSCGAGITCGDPIAGSVSVLGTNPALAGNSAMIFDSDCAGGCSGGDDDLEFQGHGNTLIVSEDQNSNDPDDADVSGSLFEFNFSNFGPGAVTVDSIDVGDIESPEGGAFLEAFSGGCGGTSLGQVPFPQDGDNVVSTVDVGKAGVDCVRVLLNGSGAIDNFRISVPRSLPAFARITGGGWRVVGSDGKSVRSSQGLTLHCDILLSNNLQINWNNGQKWHINKVVDKAFCKDDPNFTPEPPVAPADTYIGVDVGKLNNSGEAVACFIFEDHGEISSDPDGPDRALIRIWQPGNGPANADFDLEGDDPCMVDSSPPGDETALYVPLQDIDGGNLQFHFDQPHGNGNN